MSSVAWLRHRAAALVPLCIAAIAGCNDGNGATHDGGNIDAGADARAGGERDAPPGAGDVATDANAVATAGIDTTGIESSTSADVAVDTFDASDGNEARTPAASCVPGTRPGARE